MIDEAAASELENFRVKYKSVVDENNSLCVKVIVTIFNDWLVIVGKILKSLVYLSFNEHL